MKTKIGILVLAICTTFLNVQAQRRVVTARATSYDISDNLDLDAVASIFGDSENLEDFEYRLNDPNNRISNLDLNEDGYIDYLRVVENSSDRNSLVVLQAVLDEDVYQDVATIEIERVSNGNLRVQIVGDSYIYGPNYIIEPVFVRTPLIFSFFWGPRYITYHSPYYWNYYPSWYSYYSPYPTFKYHKHIHVHINRYNTYHRTSERHIQFSGDNYNHIRRSDYATRYPDRAFANRNRDVSNRNELIERRSSGSENRRRNDNIQRSNDRQYQDSRKFGTIRNEQQRNVNENRRPASNVQSGSGQTRTRENNNVSPRKRADYSNGANQIKSGKRNEGSSVSRNRSVTAPSKSVEQVRSTNRNNDSRNQSVSRPAPERSTNRIESPKPSSAPREKSGSVSRSRSNSEVKQAPQSGKKAESSKRTDKKDSDDRKRR